MISAEVVINNLATSIETLKMSPYHVDDEIKTMVDAIDKLKELDNLLHKESWAGCKETL